MASSSTAQHLNDAADFGVADDDGVDFSLAGQLNQIAPVLFESLQLFLGILIGDLVSAADRFLWAWLSSLWNGWESRVSIFKAATVIRWQRKAFGLFWSWKIRRGKPGRPAVPKRFAI